MAAEIAKSRIRADMGAGKDNDSSVRACAAQATRDSANKATVRRLHTMRGTYFAKNLVLEYLKSNADNQYALEEMVEIKRIDFTKMQRYAAENYVKTEDLLREWGIAAMSDYDKMRTVLNVKALDIYSENVEIAEIYELVKKNHPDIRDAIKKQMSKTMGRATISVGAELLFVKNAFEKYGEINEMPELMQPTAEKIKLLSSQVESYKSALEKETAKIEISNKLEALKEEIVTVKNDDIVLEGLNAEIANLEERLDELASESASENTKGRENLEEAEIKM